MKHHEQIYEKAILETQAKTDQKKTLQAEEKIHNGKSRQMQAAIVNIHTKAEIVAATPTPATPTEDALVITPDTTEKVAK